jgi:hypothetical protein
MKSFRQSEGLKATMRPNQQNNNNNNNNKNRQRGRNNNGGRKHINPLSRNFESNGPDVKVRGNASHIAEKYLQLARDAQSSGDSVMAENYLQHAEHYYRIVSAAQPLGQQRSDQFSPGTDGEDDDDDFPPINDRFSSPEQQRSYANPEPQQQPQPQNQLPQESESSETVVIQAMPAESNDAPGQPQGEGEARRRDRRPRRRGRGNGEGGPVSGDPANAPQPDVGELPAFLTAGTTPTAAE